MKALEVAWLISLFNASTFATEALSAATTFGLLQLSPVESECIVCSDHDYPITIIHC
jgi:hypothetical protein